MYKINIDKYVNLLQDVTSKDEYNNILEAQTQWKKYQEAEDIYYNNYYKASGADKIENPRLALYVFDTAVNMGLCLFSLN